MTDKPSSGIALTRIPEICGLMLNLRVFIDGKEVGKLPSSMRKVFPAAPGLHQVHVKMEMNYTRSKPISVQVFEGETVELNCGSRFTGSRWLLNILPNSLIVREGSVKLEDGRKREIIDEIEKRSMKASKRLIPFLLPTILNPIVLIYAAFIILILWLSEGLIRSLFGQYANLFTALFGLIGFGLLICVTAIHLWRFIIKEFFQE